MGFLTRSARLRAVAVFAVVGCAAVTTRSAYAAVGGSFTFTIQPDGSGNVDVSGSGTFNLAGDDNEGTDNDNSPLMNPGNDNIESGPSSSSFAADDWFSASGPSTFGSPDVSIANSGTGSFVFFEFSSPGIVELGVPTTYVSGTSISDTSIYDSTTLAAMGLTGGNSYQWTWTAGAASDTLTINVLPEPATIGLIALPAGYALLRRRRKLA